MNEQKNKNHAIVYYKALEVKQTAAAVTWLTIAIALHLEHTVPLKLGNTLISTYLIIYIMNAVSSSVNVSHTLNQNKIN